jgi:hypothetical protein
MKSKNSVRLKIMVIPLFVAVCTTGCGVQSPPPPPISVTVAVSHTAVDQGQSVSSTASVVNDSSGKGVTWSLSGTGCTGAACGALSNETASTATYNAPSAIAAKLSVKITATAAADGTTSNFQQLTVFPRPVVTTAALQDAMGGAAYSQTLQESGGVAPLTWSLASGSSLPAGLNLDVTGLISGTPTGRGHFSFTVQVSDSGNPPVPATAPLSLTVVVLPLSITTTSLPNGTIDTAYFQPVQATGGIPPYKWTVASGSLPSWASFNSATGIISGIPGASGAQNFTAKVSDSETPASTSTQPLSITVSAGTSANDSELSGHYAFLFNGFDDVTGSQVAIAGSFVADGKGNIAAGVEDENGPSGPMLSVPFTGSYNIGSDNRGAFTIITAGGTKTYALVLSSITSGVAQKARFVEFDDTTGTNGTRGSGVLRGQDTTAFTLASVTGPYAFGIAGQDAAGKRNAIVGNFTADGAGNIPSGIADQNLAGTITNPLLAGTYTAPSSVNGRATMTLNPSGEVSLDLSAYVIAAHELLVVTTNAFSSDGVMSGSILSQTSTTFTDSSLNAPVVYYQIGGTPSAVPPTSWAEIGLLSPDGKGGLTATYDSNNAGALLVDKTFTSTYSVLVGGRVTISGWYANSASPLRVLYLVDNNRAFFLANEAGVGFGFIEPQSAPPVAGFSNASLSGGFSACTASPSVTSEPNRCGLGTLDGSGNFNQIESISDTSGLIVEQTNSGTYLVAANGRGTVLTARITTAGIGTAILGIFALGAPLFMPRKPLRKKFQAFALFCLTALIATTLAGCPATNELAFYVISPTKAVAIRQATSVSAPVVRFFEQ